MIDEETRITMRADFVLIAQDRQAHQGWTEKDVREMNASIKAAVTGADLDAATDWALYLAIEAAQIRAMAQACREAEARVRAQRAAERERSEGRAA